MLPGEQLGNSFLHWRQMIIAWGVQSLHLVVVSEGNGGSWFFCQYSDAYSISMEETLPIQQNRPNCPRQTHPMGAASCQHSSHSVSLPALPPYQTLRPAVAEACSIGELEVPAEADESIYGTVFAFIGQITTTPAILGEILAQFQRIESQPHPPTPLKTAKLFPTRRGLKNNRTSINQLGDSGQVVRDVDCERGKPCVRFKQETETISIKLINSRKNGLSRSALSFKETHNPSKSIKEQTILLETDSVEELDQHSSSSPRNSYKKVSIVMFEEVDRGSGIFSSEGRISLKDLQLPELKLSEQLIEELLDSPSPFLATLALALLLKFLMRSKFTPLVTQIGWLLGVASLVAYKVFFDETIEGLVEYYSRALGMRGEDIRLLERWFLSGLNYEAVISREHYLEVMLRLAPHRATAS